MLLLLPPSDPQSASGESLRGLEKNARGLALNEIQPTRAQNAMGYALNEIYI